MNTILTPFTYNASGRPVWGGIGQARGIVQGPTSYFRVRYLYVTSYVVCVPSLDLFARGPMLRQHRAAPGFSLLPAHAPRERRIYGRGAPNSYWRKGTYRRPPRLRRSPPFARSLAAVPRSLARSLFARSQLARSPLARSFARTVAAAAARSLRSLRFSCLFVLLAPAAVRRRRRCSLFGLGMSIEFPACLSWTSD